jgi:formylglycine-generating enzyme required for sulfatase activity
MLRIKKAGEGESVMGSFLNTDKVFASIPVFEGDHFTGILLVNSACLSYNQPIGIFFTFMRPLRVFLCHASQDKPAVRKLHRYLKSRGVQPWLDELDLLPGENWEVEIPKAILSSDVILVCLSKNSVDKEGYVQKEITFALDKAQEKPEGTIFIVPVKLEDCEVPRRLKQYQWVDVFRQDGYKRLMLSLQKRASGLGADVSSVILDETRRTPTPKTLKPVVKQPEEQIVSLPVKEEIKEEPEVKFTQKKLFTKLLSPSSLSPEGLLPQQNHTFAENVVLKHEKKSVLSFRVVFWISLISGLLLLGVGYKLGIIYFNQNKPLVAVTISSSTYTATPEPSTFTSVPFTQTPTLTKTPIPTPTLGIGSIMVSEKDGMTLLYVPAGEFMMGNGETKYYDAPIYTVYLDAFWIDQTEVTNKMYTKCVSAGACKEPTNPSSNTRSIYYGDSQFDNYPVIFVDWNRAKNYCEWAGRDLPTEAQWEKSARGTDGRKYPWGSDSPIFILLNYSGSGIADATEVISYKKAKSPYGAYNIAGNVWEWVSSLYRPYPYNATDGRESPDSLENRVLRGGGWNSFTPWVDSAVRVATNPSVSNRYTGFRCARSQ